MFDHAFQEAARAGLVSRFIFATEYLQVIEGRAGALVESPPALRAAADLVTKRCFLGQQRSG